LRQRKLEVDRRTLLVDAPLATFGDHSVPLWVDSSVAPTQRTLTVRVEPKR
jgi:ribosomal protein L9